MKETSKWILVPDSFKGTMSSREVCGILREELQKRMPETEILSLPVADGGEGSVDAFLEAVGGRRVYVPCTGPDGAPMEGFFGLLGDGTTAVVEMAAAAGLPLLEGRLDVEGATTYGVGELILAAVEAGARKVILGLGAAPPTTAAVAVPQRWVCGSWMRRVRRLSLWAAPWAASPILTGRTLLPPLRGWNLSPCAISTIPSVVPRAPRRYSVRRKGRTARR